MPLCSDASPGADTFPRYRPWLLTGLVSGLFVVLFLIRRLPSSNHVLDYLQDFLHLPAFAIFFLSVRWLLRRQGFRYASLGVAAFALGVGAAIEVMQALIDRNSSWYDLLMDAAGVGVGYLCWLVFDQHLRKRWLLLVPLVMLLGLLAPLYWLLAYGQRDQMFPLLLDFDTAALTAFAKVNDDADLAVVSAPEVWHRNGTRVGRLQFHPAPWPGLFIRPAIADWRNFDSLNLQIFSPDPDTMSVAVRVDDIHYRDGSGDNFDRKFSIAPGLNELRIPLSDVRNGPPDRQMDMERVRLVFIYVPQPERPLTLYLDDVRLN